VFEIDNTVSPTPTSLGVAFSHRIFSPWRRVLVDRSSMKQEKQLDEDNK